MRTRLLFGSLIVVLLATLAVHAQVTPERLTRSASEPQNWLMYSGNYLSQRNSLLRQIDP